MAQTIKLKRSNTSDAIPTTAQLSLGELAMNTRDGKVYMRKYIDGSDSNDEVVLISGSGSITTGTGAPAGLAEGDLFYDTDDNIFQIFTSSAWKSIGFPTSEGIEFYEYDGSDGATYSGDANKVFSGNDNNSNSLQYLAGFIEVYLNGVKLQDTVDYVATDGNTIRLSESADNADVLQITRYSKFLGDGDNTVDTFTAGGSAHEFTLSVAPTSEANTAIYIDGVYQNKTSYTLSGTTLAFGSGNEPPSGAVVEAIIFSSQISAETPLAELNVTGNAVLGTAGSATATGTAIKDEDNMASNSASHLATQQSIKAYVDAQVATEDTLAELNDTTITSPADASLLLYDTGTSTWRDGAMSGDVTITDAGVTTVATLNQNTTGSAATLTTARTIHGVSFDGSANIDLSEVVQDTVGAMFSSNTETGVTVTYEDGDGTIDLVISTLNQDTTGNAATATALATARTIGGVSFDGTANINLPGVNAAGNQNTTGTAATVTTAAQPSITSLGTLTTLTVDDITINSSTISDASNLTFDVGGSLYLDSDDGLVYLLDGGTTFGEFSKSGNNLRITSFISDGDLLFRGNDGGSYITALTLDMSEAGAATFSGDVTVSGNFTVNGTTTTVNAANVIVEDPLMLLSSGASGSPSADSGLIVERGSSTNVGLIWDESHDTFSAITTTDTAATAGNVTVADYANFHAGAGTFDDGITGNLTGNASGTAATVTGAAQTAITSVGTLTGLTTSGNIGLGTATDTWHSGYDVIQGANFSLVNDAAAGASKAVTLAYNAYIDSGNAWTYMNADEASYYQQYNGAHYFSTAAAGSADGDITFSTKMTILNGGNVGIGWTSPNAPLDVKYVDNTQAQRWSYGSSQAGFYLELDTAIPSSGVVSYNFNLMNDSTAYNNNLVLDRGKVGIGTAAPASNLHVYGATVSYLTIESGNGGYNPMIRSKNADRTWDFGTFGDLSDYFSIRDTTAGGTAWRLTIDTSGNVGIGSTNPAAWGKFVVSGTGNLATLTASSGAGALAFAEGGTGRFYIKTLNGSDGLSFVDGDNSTERMRIDSNGNAYIGHTASITQEVVQSGSTISSWTPNLQVNKSANGGIAISQWNSGNTASANLWLTKSSNSTIGTHGALDTDEAIGRIIFSASDGSTFTNSASIEAFADAGQGSNDTPGRLEFKTTADGAAAPTTRMTIDKAGRTAIGHTSAVSSSTLTLNGNQSALAFSRNTGTDTTWTFSSDANNMYLSDDGNTTYNMTWLNNGNVGIGLTDPSQPLEVLKSGGAKIRLSETTAKYAEIGGFASGSANGSTIILSTIQSGTSTLTERLIIDEFGLVKLKSSGGEERFQFQPDTNANQAQFRMYGMDGSTERVHLDSYGDSWLLPESGQFGIGLTNPVSPLHIRTSTNQNLEFEETGGNLRISALNDARSANVALQFAASEFNFLTGNVGVGTDEPLQPLHLAGNSTNALLFGPGFGTIGNNIYWNGSGWDSMNHSATGGTFAMGSTGDFSWRRATAADPPVLSYSMYLDASGNLALGGHTSGIDGKLHVAGNAVVGNSSTTTFSSFTAGGLDVAVGSGTKAFQVWDDNVTGTPRFSVLRNGRVGIGTADPQSQLEIYSSSEGASFRLSTGETTIVNNDTLGAISFSGLDSQSSVKQGAQIAAKAARTWAANDYPTDLIFYTAPDNGGDVIEVLRMKGDRNVALNDGSILMGAGSGIHFGASSGGHAATETVASVVLDDYEEGNYEPTITCTSSGSYSASSNSNLLQYTKVGRMVHVHGYLNIDSESSPSGDLRISLPYAVPDLTDDSEYALGTMHIQNHAGTIAGNTGILVLADDYGYLRFVSDGGVADYVNEGHVDTSFQFFVNVTYSAAT